MGRSIFSYPCRGGSSYFITGMGTRVCQPAGDISPEKESSIQAFSEKYAVAPDLEVHASLCFDEAKERKRKK